MIDGLSPDERALLRGRQVELAAVASLRGWYPVVAADDGTWWRYFGDKRFVEPFFHDTLSSLAETDRMSLHTAGKPPTLNDTLAPTAFIFHVSRCGSTLLTQMFASLPECIVMSEPPIIDSILLRHYQSPSPTETAARLRDAVAALGQRRFPREGHLLVKLDSWHIRSLPLFRQAFPATPFLFLYRRPKEILASHGRQRGRQMVPGLVDAAMPAFEFPMPEPHDLDSHCAALLRHFFSAACRHADDLIPINYDQLPQIVWREMLGYFAIRPTPSDLASLMAAAGRHSKTGVSYAGDPDIPSSGNSWPDLVAYYERLEAIRCRQMSSCHYLRPKADRV